MEERCCISRPLGMKSSSLAPYQLMDASLKRVPLLSTMCLPCVWKGGWQGGPMFSSRGNSRLMNEVEEGKSVV